MSPDYIVSVAVPRPIDHSFTYRISDQQKDQVQVGGWVRVPFGRSSTHAYVLEKPKVFSESEHGFPASKLKTIEEVGAFPGIIPKDVMEVCQWAHRYYSAPLGEVLNAAAPAAALGIKLKRKEKPFSNPTAAPRLLKLSSDQSAAVEKIAQYQISEKTSRSGSVALLEGVTGSGKTEIYIELARRTLAQGDGVIVLVPEIALTPQLHERFESGLGAAVGLWHSAMSDGKRRDLWAALRKGEVRVVVGARSAVFAPIEKLGLIIVDEEHDGTYKQEDRVRYHARDLAIVRGNFSKTLVVLGSATPSMESLEKARDEHYLHVRLDQRVVGRMPDLEILDLRVEPKVQGTQAPLSERFLSEIQKVIEAGQQAIVFLNRRGFSAFLLCRACGETATCPNCSVTLTYHRGISSLRCHLCAHQEPSWSHCVHCKSADITPMGAGTESLEEELPRWIRGAKVQRLDRDKITSNKRLNEALDEFRAGNTNILVGTQMLVKGHDFPNVTLVGVVLADGLFRWPDFRASERAFQILTQVSGRAGRGDQPGRVLIQTFVPEHPCIRAVQDPEYRKNFAEEDRILRQELHYPPFSRMARLRVEARQEGEAKASAREIVQALGSSEVVEILGPSEAFVHKTKGVYRWDILLKSASIQHLHRFLATAKTLATKRKWTLLVDVDPYSVG